MQRRRLLAWGLTWGAGGLLLGCRNYQYAHVLSDNQKDLVGSHSAGAETYNHLIDESVAKLLARHEIGALPTSGENAASNPAICFVGVENKSAEELGDWKDLIYQQIDQHISASQHFRLISPRYVNAALRESRLRPDALFLPQNMRTFAAQMETQGQPFDYLLYATLNSGTTNKNASYQRDYILTLEMVEIQSGSYDKESATLRKGYHKSPLGKLWHYN